jgi:hypothetical protein
MAGYKIDTLIQGSKILALTLKKAIFRYRLERNLHTSQGHIVLVYQMSKVGSTSVYKSLQKGLKMPVYHIHFLSAVGILKAASFFIDAGAEVPPNIYYSDILRKYIHKMHLTIITLVRDPIGREISNYFQIGSRVFGALKGAGNMDEDNDAFILREISARISKLQDEDHSIIHTWFDSEIKSVFDIDIYSQPFDYEKGYGLFYGEDCTLILFRLENLNRSFDEGIRSVFGDQISIKLTSKNIGTDKSYAEKYREIKNGIRVAPEVCKAIFATRFGRHFYSDMADELTQKWSEPRE